MTTATIPAPTADDALASLRAILCGDGKARHRASPRGHPPAPAASGSSPPPAWQKITRKPASIFDYTVEDFEIVGYDPHPRIEAPVAV